MKEHLCEICKSNRACLKCDGCGRAICHACENFEIWGTEPGELEEKHFCPECFRSPDKNPWHLHDVKQGMHELAEAVRKLQHKPSFKSKLLRKGDFNAKIA